MFLAGLYSCDAPHPTQPEPHHPHCTCNPTIILQNIQRVRINRQEFETGKVAHVPNHYVMRAYKEG